MDIRKELEKKLKKIDISTLSDDQVNAISEILLKKTSSLKNKLKVSDKKEKPEFDYIFLSNFIENNPLAFLICDSESKIIKVNKAAIDLFTIAPDGVYIFNNPLVPVLNLKEKIKNLKKGKIESYPSFWFNPSKYFPGMPDKDICMSAIMFPIFDKNEKISNYVLLIIDYTDKQKAEEALIKNEEKYHQIFENIQDVYYEADLNGTVLEISPSVHSPATKSSAGCQS